MFFSHQKVQGIRYSRRNFKRGARFLHRLYYCQRKDPNYAICYSSCTCHFL